MRISQGALYLTETLNIVSVTETKKKIISKTQSLSCFRIILTNIVPDYFIVHSMVETSGIERPPVLNATIVCYFI